MNQAGIKILNAHFVLAKKNNIESYLISFEFGWCTDVVCDAFRPILYKCAQTAKYHTSNQVDFENPFAKLANQGPFFRFSLARSCFLLPRKKLQSQEERVSEREKLGN